MPCALSPPTGTGCAAGPVGRGCMNIVPAAKVGAY
eukprot:Gb_12121 [translate_table: standard]